MTLLSLLRSGSSRSTSSGRNAWRRGVASAAAAVLSASLLAVAAPAHAGASYQMPHKGDCHKLTINQVMKDAAPSKTVSCKTRGVTSVTVRAGLLPNGLTWSSPIADIEDAVLPLCKASRNAMVGRTAKKRAMSAFGGAWWMPTAVQRSHGANWYRCDAVVWRGHGLTPLKRTKKALLAKKVPDNQRYCMTKGFYTTSCDAPHAWRLTAAVKLSGTAYPSDISAAANAACSSKITTAKGRLMWPSEADWAAGFRFVRCFNKQLVGGGGLAKVAARSAAPGSVARQVGVLRHP